MTLRILHLIVARGGSKGLPRKNLQCVGRLSLIGYKARAALRSRSCTRLIISSDDEDMLAEGRRHGAEVPFVRPTHLATDEARSDDVVLHALQWIEAEEGREYDAVVLLEPSSPFATPAHLDQAVDLFVRKDASLVVGMRRVEIHSLFTGPLGADGRADRIVSKFAGRNATRRQDLEPEFTMNGSLYVIDRTTLQRTGRIYGDPQNTFGLVMDAAHSCEIDSASDLAFAEFLVASGELDTSPWR